MDARTEQLQSELRLIEPIISELVKSEQSEPLSRWNGIVELTDSPRIWGQMRFDGVIVVNESIVQDERRWRVLIHEMLHAHSMGLTRDAYRTSRGWEEGVVESLQRLLRPVILEQAEVTVSANAFVEDETKFSFNDCINGMEELREALGQNNALVFYVKLFGVSLAQRSGFVFNESKNLSSAQRILFLQRFSAVNRRLNEAGRTLAWN